ncbi:hypothetical protein JCM10049v2_006319 [Rhodotorula toruloides]
MTIAADTAARPRATPCRDALIRWRKDWEESIQKLLPEDPGRSEEMTETELAGLNAWSSKPTWHGVLRDALIVWAGVAFTIEVGRLSYRTVTSASVKSAAVHAYDSVKAIVHYFFAPESSAAGKAIITTHTVVVWFVGVGVLSFVGTVLMLLLLFPLVALLALWGCFLLYICLPLLWFCRHAFFITGQSEYGFARHPLSLRTIAANVLLVATAPLLVRSILQRLPFAFDAFTTVVFYVASTVALLVYAIDKQEIPLEQDATIEPTDMAEKGEKDQLGLLVDVA